MVSCLQNLTPGVKACLPMWPTSHCACCELMRSLISNSIIVLHDCKKQARDMRVRVIGAACSRIMYGYYSSREVPQMTRRRAVQLVFHAQRWLQERSTSQESDKRVEKDRAVQQKSRAFAALLSRTFVQPLHRCTRRCFSQLPANGRRCREIGMQNSADVDICSSCLQRSPS